ncbi:MAG TPA: hypothetical protein VJI12_03660 [archaeon]|nr:hypothetical protein [archaeon]
MAKNERVWVTLSKKQLAFLDKLIEEGTLGATRPIVARWIIADYLNKKYPNSSRPS